MGSDEPHLNGHAREESLLIRIRRPRAEEGSAIWSLVRRSESLESDGGHVLALLVSRFADTCLVAEAEGALIGFVGGYRTPTPPHSVLLWQIDVDPEFRGKGLGHALLHALIRCPGCADVEYLEAALESSHVACKRLLEGFARELETSCEVTSGGSETRSKGGNGQELLRIGPIHSREEMSLERFYGNL